MIKSRELLESLEERERRAVDRGRTFAEALAIFAALWAEARLVHPALGADWEDDVQADVNIARALRGLPPAA